MEPLEAHPMTQVGTIQMTQCHRMTQAKAQVDLARELEHQVMGETRIEIVIGGMACGQSSHRTPK